MIGKSEATAAAAVAEEDEEAAEGAADDAAKAGEDAPTTGSRCSGWESDMLDEAEADDVREDEEAGRVNVGR